MYKNISYNSNIFTTKHRFFVLMFMLISFSGKEGDYYRLLADGKYTVSAVIEDANGDELARCDKNVEVNNDHASSKSDVEPRQAKTVNFDFNDEACTKVGFSFSR